MDAATPDSRFPEFNLDPALAEAVETAPADQIVEGILRLEDPNEVPPLFGVVSRFNRICTGRFRAANAWTIRQHSNVISFKAARRLGISYYAEHTTSLDLPVETGVPPGSRAPFAGRGCMVAALDFGLDFAHPNFLHPGGTTRLVSFWHQGATYDAAHPNRYGYGRVFSREEINAALREADPYQGLGYHPAISDTGNGSHGTHTLDIAAGNGRVGRAGPGSEADLMFVHLSTPRLGFVGDLGDSVRMLEALDYVDRTARGRPWVVNLSVGRTAGSHDGTSLVEQGMHELLRLGPGRAIVQSAGNYRSANLAVEGWLRDGEHRDLQWIIDPADTTDNEIDVWYSGKDRFVIAIRPPQGQAFVEVKLGDVADIVHEGAVVGRLYHRRMDPNNRDNHAEVFLFPGAPPGVWTFRMIGEYVISGRFHAWIERDLALPGAQSRFDARITSQSYTLGTIATSPLVITVGAYDANSEGTPLAPFSSCGPTRDERRDKPELLAPGVAVVAARSIPRDALRQEGLLVARSGTSMATPHVTGTVAAMFEAAGRPVFIDEIRDCLKRSAERGTDGEAADCGAWGRLDTARAIREIRGSEIIDSLQILLLPTGTPGVLREAAPTFEVPAMHAEITDDVPISSQEPTVEASMYEDTPLTNSKSADDLLDRAELASRQSKGRRGESEITFLRELLSGAANRLPNSNVSPALLFRAAVGEGSGIAGFQDLLRVIGTPLNRVTDTPRRGDWMVRLVPGTGDIGHVCVLASDDLMPRSQLVSAGIAAEGSQPGYYGIVIEGGAYPHTRTNQFARRFLDRTAGVPPHTVILRPRLNDSDTPNESVAPAMILPDGQLEPAEDNMEPYRIEGGKYAPDKKRREAEHPSGLIRTASVIGKEEQKLIDRGPAAIYVSKELMRFEAGKLGDAVLDWNDFTVYIDEVLRCIGRLRDLLSAGAPQWPADMTKLQQRVLRPTDDTTSSAPIKVAYRSWRKSQAKYVGLVREVAAKRRAVELARQAFWEAKGALSRTIARSKSLGKPTYDFELGLSDIGTAFGILTLNPAALAAGVDKVLEARKARETYDAKMKEFAAAIQTANQQVKDEFEALRNAGKKYWEENTTLRATRQKLEVTRKLSREDAALVGQSIANRAGAGNVPKLLGEVRMPLLVADAYFALASIGPLARKKLYNVLAARAVIERASFHDEKWIRDRYEWQDITQIRGAWKRAKTWEPVLAKEDVDEWVAINKLWEETLQKFNV